jgi:hypothetical protein
LKKFCEYWLMGDKDWYIGGTGAEFAEVEYECPSQMMMMQSVSPLIYSRGSSSLAVAGTAMRTISAESEMVAESLSEPVDVNE